MSLQLLRGNDHVLLLWQGDGNIRYFEITTEKPYIQYLMEFRSPAPQKGLGKPVAEQQYLIYPARGEREMLTQSLTVFRNGEVE